jgi:hypothetical protein
MLEAPECVREPDRPKELHLALLSPLVPLYVLYFALREKPE